ncbi:MAG TPA: hypothetical protein VNA25_20930 [Phycisphaerae bacterium]|nr:hypothetical protein [Phycisphaerae bacterium]HUT60318.1 hypothetical protein [Phycisphaerae bacterium]
MRRITAASVALVIILSGCGQEREPPASDQRKPDSFHFVTLRREGYSIQDPFGKPVFVEYALVEYSANDLPGDHLVFFVPDESGGLKVCRATLLPAPKPLTRPSDELNYRLETPDEVLPLPLLAINAKGMKGIDCVFINGRQAANSARRTRRYSKVMTVEQWQAVVRYLTMQDQRSAADYHIIRVSDVNGDGATDYLCDPVVMQGDWKEAGLVCLLSDGAADRYKLVPVPKDPPINDLYDFGMLRIGGSHYVFLDGQDSSYHLVAVVFRFDGSRFVRCFQQNWG